MRARFHRLAGAAGALACGLAAAAWCLAAPPRHAASVVVGLEMDAAIPATYDEAALRALAQSEAVLRKAALAPDAAAAIAREARPGAADSFLALLSLPSAHTDTMSRAADLLARRIETSAGPTPNSLRIVVRMDDDSAATTAAGAIAQAVVTAHNETSAKVERKLDQTRRERLIRAERRRDAARERLAALRMVDPAPTGSVAQPARSEPDPAARALTEASRLAAAAEARRVEAARIYGPRHPEMIQIETEAKRTAAALGTARARAAASPAPRANPLAAGGPDPRIEEIANAQEEADRAEAAYARDAERFAAPGREAKIVEPARAIESAPRRPVILSVALSSLLGLALFGFAPGLSAQAAGSIGRGAPSQPIATLRRSGLDTLGARRLIEACDIAASTDARRIVVRGGSSPEMRGVIRAIAIAALEQGWRPLVVEPGPAGTAARQKVLMDGAAYAVSDVPTRAGELSCARLHRGRRAHVEDVDIAFDLVIASEDIQLARIDVEIWCSDRPPRGRTRLAPDSNCFWIAPV